MKRNVIIAVVAFTMGYFIPVLFLVPEPDNSERDRLAKENEILKGERDVLIESLLEMEVAYEKELQAVKDEVKIKVDSTKKVHAKKRVDIIRLDADSTARLFADRFDN